LALVHVTLKGLAAMIVVCHGDHGLAAVTFTSVGFEYLTWILLSQDQILHSFQNILQNRYKHILEFQKINRKATK
jgi:hypothetical protein